MPSQLIPLPANARLATLKAHARQLMREEEGEVIFEFQGPIDPEKIVKFLEWADDEYSVSVVITHAELEEFATMALAGGAVGAGAALVAKALGLAVSWPVVALAAGAGALIGVMSTTLHIRVFRYRGHTRIALKAD